MPTRPTLDDDDFGAGFDADDEFALPSAPSPARMAAAPPPPPGRPAARAARRRARPSTASPPPPAIRWPSCRPTPRRGCRRAWCRASPSTPSARSPAPPPRWTPPRATGAWPRASVEVRAGGLAGAVECYQNEPTPPLVIVECGEPSDVLLGLLDQLAEVCDPGTKVG
ncbi:MAG: hypothetical protein WDM92_13640, partial [Caulobacteraceae bacterium]